MTPFEENVGVISAKAFNGKLHCQLNCIRKNLYLSLRKYGYDQQANGLRYLRVGGRGQGLGAGKTRSKENTRKCRRLPSVRGTLCY